MKWKNLPTLLEDRFYRRGQNVALLFKKNQEWVEMTWSELGEQVLHYARALLYSGLQEGDRVAIISDGRKETIVLQMAVWMVGGTAMPMHQSWSKKTLRRCIQETLPHLIFMDPKVEISEITHPARQCIRFSPEPNDTKADSIAFRSWLAHASSVLPKAVFERLATVREDSTAILLFDDHPKRERQGVAFHHRFLLERLEPLRAFLQHQSDERVCSLLPWSHVTHQTNVMLPWIHQGSTLVLPDRASNLRRLVNQRSISSLYLSTRALESFRHSFLQRYRKKHPLISQLWKRVLENADRSPSFREKIFLRRIAKDFGTSLRQIVTAGRKLTPRTVQFFQEAPFEIFETFSLLETGTVLWMQPLIHEKSEKVFQWDSQFIQWSDTGELQIPPSFFANGYWISEEQAVKPIPNQKNLGLFFHTERDEAGRRHFWGSTFDAISLLDGSTIHPYKIESLFDRHAIVDQVCVTLSDSGHLQALIVPDFDALEARKRKLKMSHASKKDLIADPRVKGWFEGVVADVNRHSRKEQKIVSFTLLAQRFSRKRGELTLLDEPIRIRIENSHPSRSMPVAVQNSSIISDSL